MLIAFQVSRDAEVRAFEQTLLAREAELRALRAQIDPHFIFNSLHSISALTATDAAAARKMCLLLADFLRDTLRLGSSSRIPFADEWSLAERFLAIEQVRLGSRLHISRETDSQAVTCEVPPLCCSRWSRTRSSMASSQLVEGGTIRMTARREGIDAHDHGRKPLRSRSASDPWRGPRPRTAQETADDRVRGLRRHPGRGASRACSGSKCGFRQTA